MSKHHGERPPLKIRELPPKVNMLENGAEVLCPFCEIPHPIMVGQDAACGTTMKVTAVQTVYPSRTVNKHGLICLKCGKGGGEMVKFNNGVIHLTDCTPGVKLMAMPPRYSSLASIVYRLPVWARKPVEFRTGLAKQVKEIDAAGKETGRILGYFFFKNPNAGSGQRI